LSEEYGIVIVETNASYSSRECSECGYVDKDNRKTQEEFECPFCSTGLHADVNAARVHPETSSGQEVLARLPTFTKTGRLSFIYW